MSILAIRFHRRLPINEATKIESDAYWLIVASQGMKRRLRAGDVIGSLMFAVELGSLKRKLQSRWADRIVDRGRQHRTGGRRGGQERRKEAAKKYKRWRQDADALRKKHPRQSRSKNWLAGEIAKRYPEKGTEFYGARRTIRDHI